MTRSGSAVLGVLLLAAGMMLIATAVWRSAGAAHQEARAGAAALQARLAAEAGVSQHVQPGQVPPVLTIGASARLPATRLTQNVRADAAILRTSRELYRIEATGTAGSPAAVARLGFLIWRLDPGARLRALAAVARTGGGVAVASSATLSGQSVTVPPPPWGTGDCGSVQSLADSLFPTGTAPTSVIDTTAALHLGLLDQAELFPLSVTVAGVGTPAPSSVGGACLASDPWNWGSPSAPGGPCGTHRPLVAASSDLTVSAGEGQGTLLVDGQLRLTAGTRFYGMVMSSGDLIVEQGSEVYGFVRAGGRLTIGPGSRVAGSACAALGALAVGAFRRSYSVPWGWVDPL